MHRLRNEPKAKDGPQTEGKTLHSAGEYDFFSRMSGMGVNARNSRNVIELAKIKAGDRVLHVACGSGNLTLTAQTYAGEKGKVYGIDAAPEMIDVAQKKARRLSSSTIFQSGLAEQLDFPDGTFDVVISRLAIHHLPGDLKVKAFAEILRVLKPGGHVLIADFVKSSHNVLNHITPIFIGAHMMNTSAWDLPLMLTDAGLIDVASGPTRSSFLAFVSGKKP